MSRSKTYGINEIIFKKMMRMSLSFAFMISLILSAQQSFAQCTAFTVTGGGTICSGAAGLTIGLNGSTSGVSYQLMNGVANVGAPKSGTGSALSWTANTAAGTYTVVATKSTAPTCTLTMTGSATITVNPLPTLFTVSGPSAMCSGGTGITVTLSGSQSGVNYQLKRGATSVGSALAGTGSALTWTNNATAGTYTVIATDATTACLTTMTGSVVLVINALPSNFTASGTGNYCAGGTGLTIALSGSQTGVNYQLQLGGVNTGSPVAGTGSALSWPNTTGAGTYTVVATNATTSCVKTMSGSPVITVVPIPSLFTVGGGGTICSGATGPTITLNGSSSGVSYQLKNGATNVGAAKNGNGSALSWTNNATAGTYTIVAASTTNAACTATMTGTATVVVNPLPTLYTVSGTGSYCSGGTGIPIALSGSDTGTNYQLKVGSTNVGSAVAGTGSSLTWVNQTAAGTYTVAATIVSTSCVATMTGSAVITINALPAAATVSGGGAYCSGGTGVSVNLSTSVSGINYQLLLAGVNVGTPLAGTGSGLSWANQTGAGVYTVVATNAITGCVKTMTASATVTINPLPTLFNVTGGTVCSPATITIGLSGSTTGVNYQLKLNGVNSGATKAGTNAALSWGVISAVGAYTIVATNATTSCVQTMTGSAVINSLPSAVFTLTGGATICAGATGPTISLSGSETGVNYQLKVAGVNTGSAVAGTGSALTWTNQTGAGIYSVVATNATTSCSVTLASTTTVTVNPLPTAFAMSGGGSVCVGTTGSSVTLGGSQTGTNYQLKLNGSNTGAPLAGTNSNLTWTNLAVGTYTVVATNATTSCVQTMTGSAVITSNPLPLTYTMQVSSTTFCPGSGGITASLTGSQTGVNYQLNVAGSNVGSPIAGTGNPITWPNQTATGSYAIIGTVVATGCVQTMSGSAVVSVNGLPIQYTVGGGGSYPGTGIGLSITLSSSQTGASYQLLLNAAATGTPLQGNGSLLTWSDQRAAGTYTVLATGNTTTCTQTMIGSATITLDPTWVSLDHWGFLYKYDARNRMVQKKVPGADWTYMVYDLRDRLVMTQDGNQRINKQWSFTKYDALNRPVITGIYTHPTTLDQVAMSALISTTNFFEAYNGDTNNHGYTNTVFATPNFDVAKFDVNAVTYYDDYVFKGLFGNNIQNDYLANDILGSQTSLTGTYVQEPVEFTRVNGQVTGTKTKILGTSTYLLDVHYFDAKFRSIQTVSDNQKGGKDRHTNIVDFTGKVLATKTTHKIPSKPDQTIVRTFTYDAGGRLLKTFHTLDTLAPVLLTQNEYNELGQLVDKKLYSTDGGASFKQSVDYRYNIRGWLTTINNSTLSNDAITNDDTGDLFGMELAYNNALTGLSNGSQFNGNISAMKWSVNQGLSLSIFGTPTERAYNFSYDALNRLTAAAHLDNKGLWAANTSFHEENLQYDQNGNILSLNRTGPSGSSLDVLSYDYGTGSAVGNQLHKVTDGGDKTKGFIDGGNSGDDYTYDANGNMLTDQNKGLTGNILYNYLNLPAKVSKTPGDSLRYLYDAGGRKLTQKVYKAGQSTPTKVTDYVGEFIYQNDTLLFVNTEEGRVVMKTGTPEYQFNMKDHLGNVRMTFTTKNDVDLSTATLETANAPTEQGKFLNYTEAIIINSTLFDHSHITTPSNTTFYSTRLTGLTTNAINGLAKSLSVMPGDKIDIEVYAKYLDPNNANWTAALANFIASIAAGGGAPAGTIIDGGFAGSLGNGVFPYPGQLVRTGDNGTGPKAYLNYLLFDRNFVYKTGGFKRISANPRETGNNVAHDRLSFDGVDQILIHEPGYMYIWLSNENDTPVEVYFDDFKVTQTKSPVVQTDDYYPFGLTFNEYQRENSLLNKYQFNGKEIQNELSLDWLDFHARSYLPEIGRFLKPDFLSQLDPEHSSYTFVTNNPIRFTDPDGHTWKDDNQRIGLVKSILDRRASLVEKLDGLKSGSDDAKKLQKRIERLDASVNDVQKLQDDPLHIYKLDEGSTHGTGLFGVTRDSDGEITIHGSDRGTQIHEIRHTVNTLDKHREKFDEHFNEEGKLTRPMYREGAKHEADGYRAEYSYSGKGPGDVSSEDIEVYRKIATMRENGFWVYPDINAWYIAQSQKPKKEKQKK